MMKLTTIAMSIALAGSFAVSGLAIADHHGGNKERSGYSMEEKAEKKGTISEIAANNGSFNTLVAALGAAELVEVLNGEGPFTVFAPTDDAFAALPEGTVESLLQPENRDQLVAILTYHVVPGKVMSADLSDQQLDADTVEGSSLNIDATGYGVTVNGANVVTADIEADNGVIHVIDTVLMPGN